VGERRRGRLGPWRRRERQNGLDFGITVHVADRRWWKVETDRKFGTSTVRCKCNLTATSPDPSLAGRRRLDHADAMPLPYIHRVID
jgi:alpha-L-fucosidase